MRPYVKWDYSLPSGVVVKEVFTDKVSASINAVGTFARSGGYDYGINGVVNVAF